MTENERYQAIKYNDLYNVTDTLYNISIINHIHQTQAKRVADNLNRLNDEKSIITDDYTDLQERFEELKGKWIKLSDEFATIYTENADLKKENKKILDTINNKITEKGMNWYKAEDNSKEEKEANIQLNVLEEIKDELKEKLNEDDKMGWSKKTENTVQDIDGEEYNIQEIVNALNHYQRTVDELRRENYELYNRVNENTNNIK